MNRRIIYSLKILCTTFSILLIITTPAISGELITGKHLKFKAITSKCTNNVTSLFNNFIKEGKLTQTQLFDTFYIPIPNTYPQKYHTQYDQITDNNLRNILDNCLDQNSNIVFVVAVDKNGYLPTHNTKYSAELTGKPKIDIKKNRTKRIFNGRTGLTASKNIKPFLLQKYNRDTGKNMFDISSPIFIDNKHWGALRIGYKIK